MPTTIDRFFGVVQLCQNLSTMQNNMRANVVFIQAKKNDGTLPTFAAAQQAFRDLGTAFNQRLDLNATVVANFNSDVQAGATAIGVSFADMTSVAGLLRTWANTLSAVTVTNQTQMDNGVAALLAAVPPAMLPF